MEHDRALRKVVLSMLADHTELFKRVSDNPSFKKWLSDTIFGVSHDEAGVELHSYELGRENKKLF